MSSLLELHVASKVHGERTILRDVHLTLAEGEFVSLVGASGSGKSTLLSILAGLDRDWQGRLTLAGREQAGTSPDIGLVFQEPRLFPWLTVTRNVAFGRPDAAGAETAALLAEVGLGGLGDYLPRQLSGGQAQRVAIARGLVTQPRVLLLDEPFSAVDALTRVRLQDLLLRVARRHRLTVLLVTHDLDEALFLGERVVMLGSEPGAPCRDYHVPHPAGTRRRADPALGALKAHLLDQLVAAPARQ